MQVTGILEFHVPQFDEWVPTERKGTAVELKKLLYTYMVNCRNLRSTVIRALGAENLVVVKLNFNGNDNWVYKLKNVKFEPSSKTLQTSQIKVYVDLSLFFTVKINVCFMPDMI